MDAGRMKKLLCPRSEVTHVQRVNAISLDDKWGLQPCPCMESLVSQHSSALKSSCVLLWHLYGSSTHNHWYCGLTVAVRNVIPSTQLLSAHHANSHYKLTFLEMDNIIPMRPAFIAHEAWTNSPPSQLSGATEEKRTQFWIRQCWTQTKIFNLWQNGADVAVELKWSRKKKKSGSDSPGTWEMT